MPNIERLTSYYPFSDAVLAATNDSASYQENKSFSELADLYGIADGPKHFSPDGFNPIEAITIKPKCDYDEHHVRVFQAPFDITAEGVAAKAMRLFGADPTTQLIAYGAAGSIGNPYNKINGNLFDLLKVWGGNLDPVVEPQLAHMASIGITSAEQTGFSWGGDKALASSGELSVVKYRIETTKVVSAETVSMANRGVVKNLLPGFWAARKELANYQEASYVPVDADKAIKTGLNIDMEFFRWAGGMFRLSNMVMEKAMARDNLPGLVRRALVYNHDLKVALPWGTSSELVYADEMQPKVDDVDARQHRPGRIIPMVMRGMHHAGGDDLDLLTATIFQGLELTAA